MGATASVQEDPHRQSWLGKYFRSSKLLDTVDISAKRLEVQRRTMLSILNNDSQRRLFARYLESDYCVELAKFMRAVEEFETLFKTVASLRDARLDTPCPNVHVIAKAVAIFDDFLDPTGRWFIYPSARNAALVKKDLQKPGLDVFAPVQHEVLDFFASRKLERFRDWLSGAPPDIDDEKTLRSWSFGSCDAFEAHTPTRKISAASAVSSVEDAAPEPRLRCRKQGISVYSSDDELSEGSSRGSLDLTGAKLTLVAIWGQHLQTHRLVKRKSRRASAPLEVHFEKRMLFERRASDQSTRLLGVNES